VAQTDFTSAYLLDINRNLFILPRGLLHTNQGPHTSGESTGVRHPPAMPQPWALPASATAQTPRCHQRPPQPQNHRHLPLQNHHNRFQLAAEQRASRACLGGGPGRAAACTAHPPRSPRAPKPGLAGQSRALPHVGPAGGPAPMHRCHLAPEGCQALPKPLPCPCRHRPLPQPPLSVCEPSQSVEADALMVG
jgi:hypothetical protein